MIYGFHSDLENTSHVFELSEESCFKVATLSFGHFKVRNGPFAP